MAATTEVESSRSLQPHICRTRVLSCIHDDGVSVWHIPGLEGPRVVYRSDGHWLLLGITMGWAGSFFFFFSPTQLLRHGLSCLEQHLQLCIESQMNSC